MQEKQKEKNGKNLKQKVQVRKHETKRRMPEERKKNKQKTAREQTERELPTWW